MVQKFGPFLKNSVKGVTWLTDSRQERWAAIRLEFYDQQNDYLYFTAARSTATGSDEETEQHKRQIFRVKSKPDLPRHHTRYRV